MDRSNLISRKAVYRKLIDLETTVMHNYLCEDTASRAGTKFNGQISAIKEIKDYIANMPSAFDCDEVIEKIKNNPEEAVPYYIKKRTAIKIIKEGKMESYE